jgi:hypothetical protein
VAGVLVELERSLLTDADPAAMNSLPGRFRSAQEKNTQADPELPAFSPQIPSLRQLQFTGRDGRVSVIDLSPSRPATRSLLTQKDLQMWASVLPSRFLVMI